MVQRTQWRPGYVAMVFAAGAVVLVLFLTYRPAVRWFNAVDNYQSTPTPSPSSPYPPTLPVTGRPPVPIDPGLPWWSFTTIISVMFLTLFLWSSGRKNLLALFSYSSAAAAERRARFYTFDADIYRRLNAEKTARYFRSLAGGFARTSLALHNASKVLNRIESAGTKLEMPPVEQGDLTIDVNAPEYQGMPPRLDSLNDN